jgi:hypothetical protein
VRITFGFKAVSFHACNLRECRDGAAIQKGKQSNLTLRPEVRSALAFPAGAWKL